MSMQRLGFVRQIAGAGKRTPADCRKYFDIARGSAMECGVHLDVCAALRVVVPDMIERGKAMLEREVAMLMRLSQSQGRPAQPTRPPAPTRQPKSTSRPT
jgi:hypothetical protein